jgi:indole-3-glycerol phosphate synthase
MLPEGTPNRKMPVLDAIVDATRRQLPALRARRAELERAAAGRAEPASFSAALRGDRVAVIAEIKRRSPSAGAIQPLLDPAKLARAYRDGGAAAVSVLTEADFFGGTIADLSAVTSAVNVPVLRKDFIVDEVQLLDARATGASAALLIVRILTPEQLGSLLRFAALIGLDSLVETHGPDELRTALDQGATIVGVNSRDLDTLVIDAPRAWQLLAEVPGQVIAVAESGMRTVADVQLAAAAGADAVLVGSALAGSSQPRERVGDLTGVVRHAR